MGPPKLLAAIGGIMLMTFWFLRVLAYEERLNLRWSRIHEIERLLGLNSHLRLDRGRAKSIWKGHRIRCGMFTGYMIIDPFFMCDARVEAADTRVTTFHNIVRFIRNLSDTMVDVYQSTLWIADEWTLELFISAEAILVCVIAYPIIIVCFCVWIWKRKHAILKKLCKILHHISVIPNFRIGSM